ESASASVFPYTTLFRSVGGEVTLLEPRRLTRAGAGQADVGQRFAAPQCHGLPQQALLAGLVPRRARPAGILDEPAQAHRVHVVRDRKSTRLNSSHVKIS